MGFFKKIFKGIKKVVKKIGKGIKSAFKKVGKFMNKIGIVGQIGMMFILPGIGGMLAKGFTNIAGAMAGYSGIGSSIINGAGKFLQAAYSRVGGLYNSITKGVTDVIGKTATNIASSLGVDPTSKTGQFLSNTLGVNVVEPGTAQWRDVFDTAGNALSNIGTKATELITGPPPTKPVTLSEQLASNIAEGNIAPESFRQSQLDMYSQNREATMQSVLDDASKLDDITPGVTKTTFPDQLSTAGKTAAEQLRQDTLGSMESLMAPKPTASALQEVVVSAQPVSTEYTRKSLLGSAIDAGRQIIEDIPGNVRASIEGAPEAFGEYIRETPKELLSRAGSGAITQVLQEAGLVDEPIYNQYVSSMSVPSMLGTSASIGQNLDTGQPTVDFASVAGAYRSAVSNGFLYGDAAFVPDVYGSRMKELYGMAA